MSHRRTWVQVGPALDSKSHVFPSSIHGGRNREQMMTPGAMTSGRRAGALKGEAQGFPQLTKLDPERLPAASWVRTRGEHTRRGFRLGEVKLVLAPWP